ncbi:MAG: type II secretion system protein [Deltaproteobacteria bacterium]|nr:type II secretion system protein [Deltaproteobacteria bacterium]
MRQKGFTLVEVILTIVVIGILFAVSSIVLRQGLDSYSHILNRSNNLQTTRYAMERMIRELTLVGDTNPTNIQNIQSDRITYVDSDSNTTNFNFANGTLYRSTDPLLNNVTAVTFTGFKDTGATTTAGNQVRRVRIQLSTLPPNQTTPLNLRTDIFIRNYMYENFR